jgi:tRNA modification GTPase
LTIIETSIDFPDEDFDISPPSNELSDRLTALVGSVNAMITSYDSGRIYREGFAIAIVGRPNVGKSSLMNTLLERERVIVTPTPGTTRDTVEETLHLDGIAVRIIDTAGVRETVDEVESIGIDRTMTAIDDADMALLILDGSEQMNDDDLLLLSQLGSRSAESDRLLVAINKSDCDEKIDRNQLQQLIPGSPLLLISAKNGVGIDNLKGEIVTIIKAAGKPMSDGPVVTRQRHCDLLRRMGLSIESAITAIATQMSEEFIAADLREAKEALEELTGESVTDAVIDKIFHEFCIGK